VTTTQGLRAGTRRCPLSQCDQDRLMSVLQSP